MLTCTHAHGEHWAVSCMSIPLSCSLGFCSPRDYHPTLAFPSSLTPITLFLFLLSFVFVEYETEVQHVWILSYKLPMTISVPIPRISKVLKKKNQNDNLKQTKLRGFPPIHIKLLWTKVYELSKSHWLFLFWVGEVVCGNIFPGSFLCFLSRDWSGGQGSLLSKGGATRKETDAILSCLFSRWLTYIT